MIDGRDDNRFRYTAGGREPLAPAGEAGLHAHYSPMRRVGIGTITSRKSSSPELTFWDVLAWNLSGAGGTRPVVVPGCTAAKAKELHEKGLVK